MAYCSYCAGVLDPGQPVCPKCGRPVEAAPAPAPPAVVNERPKSVRLAVILLLISSGISLLSFGVLFRVPSLLTRFPASFFFGLVFVIGIWQRQAWARIATVLLLVWGIANLLISILRIGGSVAFASSLFVPLLVNGLRVWAVYLLFKPESNTWLRK
jgi:hypothetical protein